jgi:heme-degrading monooxygenase HmoA
MFVYIWTFDVRPGCEDDFVRTYGADGEWCGLFRRHPGYLRTELLRDVNAPLRWCTIDYWRSRTDRDEFRAQHAAAFEELDARCESMTVSETHVGDYEA